MTLSDTARIGELLDEAIEAVNNGDFTTAHDLAELVLLEDSSNLDAGELLAAEGSSNGELRRLTILCCDLVGSTELSERQEPERYRTLVRRYRTLCKETIEDRYDGHIISVKGDGFLALFGYPSAHEDDSRRAVQAGLDLCRAIGRLSGQAQREVGEAMDVRVGIHRGLVFIDIEDDDVYGLAANLASRVEGLATPGTVVITDEVLRLVADRFEVTEGDAQPVKGVSEPIRPFTVFAERLEQSPHRFPTPLIGRVTELAALRSAWLAAMERTAPRTTSVLIRGEPGIGKSRLAAAIAQEARDQRAVVVELAGSPFHVGAGFHPIQVLLEQRCGIDGDADGPERLRRLRQELAASGADPDATVPLLAPILGLAPNTGYEAVAAEGRKLNEEITTAVYEYLVACFGGGTGVLLVDDVQWLDESTITLLSRVLAYGPGTLLVVLTSREDAPFSVGTIVELQPLAHEECLQLVDALQPDGLPADARASLADRSDGVPLYLEELVRGWGSGSAQDGSVHIGETVPDALYEPLVARLMSTAAGMTVAVAAATIGRDVDRVLLAAVLDLAPEELDPELEALTAGKILVPTGRGETYRFRHELLRGVAYELQPPATRRKVHGRVADLLVLGGESDEVVDWNLAATHYERARRPREAAGAYAHAADRARRRGALAEARSQLGRSIEMITNLPADRDHVAHEVSLRLRRGFLAMSAEGAGSAEAASDYARCLQLAMADARGDEMFSSLISLWAYHLARAELDRTREVLETLRTGLAGSREWFRPANDAGFGIISWFEGDFGTAREILEAAEADLAGGRTDAGVADVWFVPNDPTASIHTHLALARFMSGDSAGADAEMAHSVALTATLDFPQGPWSNAYAAWLRSWMLAERGELDHAASVAAELLELSTRHGFDSWTMVAMTQQAAVDATRAVQRPGSQPGVAADHAAALAGLVGMWQAVDLLVFLPYYLTMTGAALAAADDREGARSRYEEALALGDRTGMTFYAAEATRRLALLADDASQRDVQLRSALEIARAQGARPFELRVALDLHDLNGSAATPLLEAALRDFSPDAASPEIDAARARIAAKG